MTLPLIISPGDSGHISHHEQIHAFLAPIVSPFSIAEAAQGTFASRPAAGVAGRFYRTTDTNVLYFDSGSGWVAVHDLLSTWNANLLTTGYNLSGLKVPSCIATKTVAQTISNNSPTAITFPTEDYDNDGMHSVSSLTSRITFNRAGLYIVGCSLSYDIGPIALNVQFKISATTFTAGTRLGTGSITPAIAYTELVNAAATDFVEVFSYPTSSPAASVDCTSGRFWATLVSTP